MEGTVIAGYRIVRRLGAGGMGSVYEACHQHLGRRAAIKLLHPGYCADRDALSRFYTEARAASLAQHPSVIDIYEFGFTEDGHAYLIMELIEGCSLANRLRQLGGRMGTPCLRIAQKLAAGLAFLHARGIVHRDLKPDNVMLLPDPDVPMGERVKLLDFGIAKLLNPQPKNLPISANPTTTGAILGTPAYLSPEQARGERAQVGPPADVYALGILLYELLSGGLPFQRESPMEVVMLHVFAEPEPLLKRSPRTPKAVARLVHRMLNKDPAQRPTMGEVAGELEQLSARYERADVPTRTDQRAQMPAKAGVEWELLWALIKRRVADRSSKAFMATGAARGLHVVVAMLLFLPSGRALPPATEMEPISNATTLVPPGVMLGKLPTTQQGPTAQSVTVMTPRVNPSVVEEHAEPHEQGSGVRRTSAAGKRSNKRAEHALAPPSPSGKPSSFTVESTKAGSTSPPPVVIGDPVPSHRTPDWQRANRAIPFDTKP